MVRPGLFQLQARPQRGVGDLELRGARLAGAETVLELVARPRERARERVRRMARHPAEDLDRRRDGTDRADRARRGAVARRHLLGGEIARGVRQEHRPDQVRAAALVLLRARRAVLVRADRDVLGAVIRGELAAAQRERRGREREGAREQFARERSQPRPLDGLEHDSAADHRGEHAAAAPSGAAPPGSAALDLRQQRERLGEPRRPAQQRVPDRGGAEPLAPRHDLQLAVVGPHRAGPGLGPVHEDAVRKRHATEPDGIAHRRGA